MLTEDDNSDVSLNDENDTYIIEETTQAFLELAFELKKPTDNKTYKTWKIKLKFKVQEKRWYKMP